MHFHSGGIPINSLPLTSIGQESLTLPIRSVNIYKVFVYDRVHEYNSIAVAYMSWLYVTDGCVGPFGDHDDQQVFVQKVVPDTDQLFVRHSCSGKRLLCICLLQFT